MNIVDRVLQSNGGFRLLLNIFCIIILSIFIIIEPRYRTGGLIILLVGMGLTVRQYRSWRLKRREELEIGKYREQTVEKAPDA